MASLKLTKYQLDSNAIATIRCLAAVSAVADNDEPEGEVDTELLPKVSKNNSEYGVRPRFVTLTRQANVGNDANDKKTYRAKLIILTPNNFNSFNKGDEVTFNGKTWTVARKVVEDY